MANEDMKNMQDHHPHREDQVEAWIQDRRDQEPENMPGWWALDNLLDEYRLAADTGQSLENIVNGEEERDPLDQPAKKMKKQKVKK